MAIPNEPDKTVTEPPSDLTERSQGIWRAVAFPGCPAGRLEALHSGLKALDRADQAAAILDREGLTTTNKATGVVHVHPAQRVEKDARAMFHRVWDQLGLNSLTTPKPWGV